MAAPALLGIGPERIPAIVEADHLEIARRIAARIADLIRERNRGGRFAVLGLATGSTPIGVYRELIRLHREEKLDFSRVETFNLDEYFPMAADSVHGFRRFMWENFFEHVNDERLRSRERTDCNRCIAPASSCRFFMFEPRLFFIH